MLDPLVTKPSVGHFAVLLDDRRIEQALAGLYRAISACQFYPPNHPTLAEALAAGYQAWTAVQEDYRWEQPGLQLRSGGLWFGETRLGVNSPAVAGLTRVLSGHGLIGLRRTGELPQAAFQWLITTLAAAPDLVAGRGGLRSAWQRQPFAASLALEALTVAAGGGSGTVGGSPLPQVQRREQWGESIQPSAEGLAGADPYLLSRLRSLQQRSPRERVLVDHLLRLGSAADINEFLTILREITRVLDSYLEVERFREAFYVVLFLYREAQNMDACGDSGKRDYLLDTVRLVLKGDFLGWLIEDVAADQGAEEVEVGGFILRALGRAAVVPVINALCAEGRRMARRRLVNVLVSIGEPAVPLAVKMLEDQRWFVVRNMVTVLGGIGSPDAMKALLRLAVDQDPRIRKEVARSLGRCQAETAEEALLALLEDRDLVVQQMAVRACAVHPSDVLFDAVWRVYQRVPIRHPHWELKVVALHTLARMGLGQAEEHLLRVLHTRHWFARERWHKVHVAAVQALGRVGTAGALRALRARQGRGGPELQTAVERAVSLIERRAGGDA